jgi:hypothetical protein
MPIQLKYYYHSNHVDHHFRNVLSPCERARPARVGCFEILAFNVQSEEVERRDHSRETKGTIVNRQKEFGFLRQVFYHAANEWSEDWDCFFSDFTNPVGRVMKGLRDNVRIPM